MGPPPALRAVVHWRLLFHVLLVEARFPKTATNAVWLLEEVARAYVLPLDPAVAVETETVHDEGDGGGGGGGDHAVSSEAVAAEWWKSVTRQLVPALVALASRHLTAGRKAVAASAYHCRLCW